MEGRKGALHSQMELVVRTTGRKGAEQEEGVTVLVKRVNFLHSSCHGYVQSSDLVNAGSFGPMVTGSLYMPSVWRRAWSTSPSALLLAARCPALPWLSGSWCPSLRWPHGREQPRCCPWPGGPRRLTAGLDVASFQLGQQHSKGLPESPALSFG